MYRVWNFITNYSLLLIAGALIALVWANIDPKGYHHFVEWPLWFNDYVGLTTEDWIKKYGKGYDAFAYEGHSRVLSFHLSLIHI